MGMSASQARFLSLTARKNNVEFEGQQINQQRTTLSNQSASYYSELCNMVVPTPPSVDDYTKISYTFNDGALNNTITSMIVNPSKPGYYSIGYIQQWQDDYSIVSSASSMVCKDNGQFKIGSATLRKLGEIGDLANSITLDGKTYEVKNDEKGYYVDKLTSVSSVEECTADDIANFEYYLFDENFESATQLYKDVDGSFYSLDENNNKVPVAGVTEDTDNLVICLYVETQGDAEGAVSLVVKDAETGKYYKEVTTEEVQKYYLTTSEISSIADMDGKTPEEIQAILDEEALYKTLLTQMQGQTDGDWYVRYIKDSTTGINTPYFYNDLENANYVENYANVNCYTIGSTTKTKEVLNQPGKVEKDSSGRYISIVLYQTDDNGDVLPDKYTTYTLTTNTATDEDAYNDAMNQYNYAQHQYEKKIQEINSKLEIVQQQDKSLELNLKQLDTEENAISTELESVKKVISKNVESSFKTFSA